MTTKLRNKTSASRALLATGTILSMCCVTGFRCQAQDSSSSQINSYLHNNQQQSMVLSQLAVDLALANAKAQKVLGQQRIGAGKASTLFMRSPERTSPAAIAARQTNLSERERLTKLYKECLIDFENFAVASKVPLDDIADGRGLAFVLAYEVYSGGQRANDRQRFTFAAQTRDFLLRDAYFQGSPDRQRQLDYDEFGITAILALGEYREALRSNDAALRGRAVERAAGLMGRMWSGNVLSLELSSSGFGDRGERIIREGKSTALFVLSQTPVTTDAREIGLWRAFVQQASTSGLTIGDLGQGQALALAINYKVYSGRPLTPKQFQWALQEMRKDVLTQAGWQGSSDREKQRSLESYGIKAMSAVALQQSAAATPTTEEFSGVFLAVAQAGGIDKATKARQAAENVRRTAKANLEELFAPARVFDDYVLTDSGFVPKNGAAH